MVFAKSHVLFGPNRLDERFLWAPAGPYVQFGSILVIGAKAPVTLQTLPGTLWLEPQKSRELWLEFNLRDLQAKAPLTLPTLLETLWLEPKKSS